MADPCWWRTELLQRLRESAVRCDAVPMHEVVGIGRSQPIATIGSNMSPRPKTNATKHKSRARNAAPRKDSTGARAVRSPSRNRSGQDDALPDVVTSANVHPERAAGSEVDRHHGMVPTSGSSARGIRRTLKYDARALSDALNHLTPTLPITLDDTAALWDLIRPLVVAPLQLTVMHDHKSIRIFVHHADVELYARTLTPAA